MLHRIKLLQVKGLYKGRKPVKIAPDDFARIYMRWRTNKEITAKKAMGTAWREEGCIL